MQNRETRGFFFNSVLRRPLLLRTLLRGFGHHGGERGAEDEKMAARPPLPGTPLRNAQESPAQEERKLKKICGL